MAGFFSFWFFFFLSVEEFCFFCSDGFGFGYVFGKRMFFDEFVEYFLCFEYCKGEEDDPDDYLCDLWLGVFTCVGFFYKGCEFPEAYDSWECKDSEQGKVGNEKKDSVDKGGEKKCLPTRTKFVFCCKYFVGVVVPVDEVDAEGEDAEEDYVDRVFWFEGGF